MEKTSGICINYEANIWEPLIAVVCWNPIDEKKLHTKTMFRLALLQQRKSN
jgi:hypothetical protein